MAAEQLSAAVAIAALSPDTRRERRTRLTGLLLISPAVVLTFLFLLFPLVFIVQMSFTAGKSFLSAGGATFTTENFVAMAGRYLPNLLVTGQLAALSMVANPSFRFPFPPLFC